MSYQDLLRAKALEICEECATKGLPQPRFALIEQSYLINFTWFHEGKKQILSLYYKPTCRSWTLSPKSDWLKRVITPAIESLCLSPAVDITATSTSSAGNLSGSPSASVQAYFADALSCLDLLRPFAVDNVDCSIICQLTRRAVECILSDPVCSSLNRADLVVCIGLPDATDFFLAKEYLKQCLTLCHISNVVN